MTTTLYLHIGLPKTGSTWLQDEVFPELTHLEAFSVPRTKLFQDQGDRAVERRLMACVLGRSVAVWEALGDAVFEELLGAQVTWMERKRSVLVSDEAIGRQASRPEAVAAHLAAMRERAREWGFDRLKVICAVRRQDRWFASHFAQMSDRTASPSQTGFAEKIASYIDPGKGRYKIGMLLDYAALHEALTQVLPGDVQFLPYEEMLVAPEAFLTKLLRGLDTPEADVARLTERRTKRANVRSEGAEGRLWRLRAPSILLPLVGQRLPLPDMLWPRRTIELTSELSASVLSAYRVSNETFASRSGLDLSAYGYFPPEDG